MRVHRPSPALYQPPQRWYSELWKLLVALVVSAFAWSTVAEQQLHDEPVLLWVDVLVGAACFVLAVVRRRAPLLVAVLVTLAGVVSFWSLGPALLVGVSIATRRRWGEIIAVGLVGMVVGQVMPVVQPLEPEPWWVTFTTNLGFTVAMLALGMYIGSRRELIWTLRERAREAEAEQEARVAHARTAERARIAREMHDVLAHRISLVSMHAGALGYRRDLSPDEVGRSAEVIQQNAHQALLDLRHVLGVLRQEEGSTEDHAPQPTLADLPALADEARRAGIEVDLRTSVDGDVPEQVGRTVYRIVQEGVTNARKHSPGARVAVAVTGGPDSGIEVVVSNPAGFSGRPSAPGAGLGLVGLAERAELAGGRLSHGREDGSFTLRGWLPWAP